MPDQFTEEGGIMQVVTRSRTYALIVGLALMLIVCALAPDSAQANSRIRAGGCDVYQTVLLDPIAGTSHLHHFIMGQVISNTDTGFDYKARALTSCNAVDNWATSAGWYPKPKNFSSDKATVYYRDPGNIRVSPIPTDLRMLNSQVLYKGNLTTVQFGNCLAVDTFGRPVLDSLTHTSHIEDKRANPCDSSHPYRIPRISFLIHWNGKLTSSTPVSAGDGQYLAGSFHADYQAGVQDEFNFATAEGKALIDLCLNDVPLSVQMASARCGVGP
jgi:Domain of unknown function (DUF1996)